MSVVLWIAAAYVVGVMGCLFGQWVENETRKAEREAQERRVAEFLVLVRRAKDHSCSSACRPGAHALFALAA